MKTFGKKSYYIIFIVASSLLISYLHFSTSLGAHALHSIHAELYFIPILLGALLGLKGAILTYVFVSSLYFLPFIFVIWTEPPLFLIDSFLHLLFSGLFAFLVGFLIDRRMRYQRQLEEDKIELQRLDKLKSSFLANVSHELRTPMTAITGYTDLLLDRVDGPINEEQEKSLKKISSHSKRLLQLINDILDVSKMESEEKIRLELKELDIKMLVDSIVKTFEPFVRQKGLTLTISIDENLPPIYCDRERITQILINLLSNAVKFTHEGGITITAKPSEKGIKQDEPPLFAEVCIKDTGIGIMEEDLSKIFGKFVQVDPSAVRQYEGTGLGLNIVKRLVELQKGQVWVTSKYGEGSTFCFTLPFTLPLKS